ncbi:MAG: hypothetical protein HKM28_07310 [Flavobacteriaceae bacterium]|nr:hypothetical protein [Flavobacteriaceae bacterium]
MKQLAGWFDFYLNSSIHVALAVCALVVITLLEFGIELSWSLLFFTFFGTVTGYNFVKYSKIAGLHHHSLTDMLKTIQVFSFFSFLLLVFFATRLSLATLGMVTIFGSLTFFYAVPLLHNKNLRTLEGMKIFVVAMVWAGVTVLVPIVEAELPLGSRAWITFVQRFLIVIVLTIPFEIRDLKYDQLELKTLPQLLGLKGVKILGLAFVLLIMLLEPFKGPSADNKSWVLGVVCLLLIGGLFGADKIRSKYFASLWVEGIPILWLGLAILFANFAN